MKLVNSSLLIKYISGGIFTALTEYLLFALLLVLSTPLLAANTLSFVAALSVSFWINRNLVFDVGVGYRQSAKRQLLLYGGLALFNLLMSNLLISVLAVVVPPLLAKLGTMILIAGYNLLIYRLGIFKTTIQQ